MSEVSDELLMAAVERLHGLGLSQEYMLADKAMKQGLLTNQIVVVRNFSGRTICVVFPPDLEVSTAMNLIMAWTIY